MTGLARIDDPQPIAHLEISAAETKPHPTSLPCHAEAIAKSTMGNRKYFSGVNEWYPVES